MTARRPTRPARARPSATSRGTPGCTCPRAPARSSSTGACSRRRPDIARVDRVGGSAGMSIDTSLPARLTGVGIGLRARHIEEVRAARPPVPWFEVHAENYMGGGMARRALEEIRRSYPISLHGVGLSLGSADGVDRPHLRRLRALVEWLDPTLVSEHLSWSGSGGVYLNHLLPLPYTEESLETICRHVDQTQDALGMPILIENPSSYLRFRQSAIPEPDFLAELARRTGCGLL